MRNSYIARRLFLAFSIIIMLFTGSVVVQAQTAAPDAQPEACKELPILKDFYRINDLRGGIQGEISVLEAKVKDFTETKIPGAIRATTDLAETNKKIDTIVKKPTKTPADEQQLDSLTTIKTSIENFLNGKDVEAFRQELKTAVDDLSWKKEQLQCINNELSKYTVTPEQNFKQTMSIAFALLLGLVFAGFFAVALYDEQVRRAVFAGQSGLQFLALFSIVIAIILFGITTILEARELAALLGSLAGYILGRVTAGPGNGAEVPNGMKAFAAIDLAPLTLTLAVGKTDTVKASPLDKQGVPIIAAPNEFTPSWSSDNPAIATVDQLGQVKAVGVGTCKITAEFKSIKSANCVVSVV